jgi:hypothetical protein
MKTRIPFLFLLLLLCVTPARAAELPVTVHWQNVTDCTLVYTVAEGVTNVTVTKRDDIWLEVDNLEGNKLTIALANATVLDTTTPLVTISADLPEGMTKSDAFQLTELQVNGVTVSGNVAVTEEKVEKKQNGTVEVSVSVSNDLVREGKTISCYFVAYDAKNRFLRCGIQKVKDDQPLTQQLTGCADAASIKIFILDGDSYIPVSNSTAFTLTQGS